MRGKYWILAGVLAASGTLSGCSLLPEQEVVRTAPVIREYKKDAYDMAVVERGDLVKTERVSARYVPVQKESLTFPLTDEYVDRMLVQVGDFVEKGQLLGQQRVDDIEKAIGQSEITVRELEMRLANADALHEIELQRVEIGMESAGRQALEEALQKAEEDFAASRRVIEDQLTVEKLNLASLREDLAVRQLRAPFSGTVTFVRDYDEGHRSTYAEVAVTLADSTMTLFRAETKLWPYFHTGDVHQIEVDDEFYTLEVVDEVSLGLEPKVREEGKKGYVYFALTEPNPELEEDDGGMIDLEMERRENVLHVPSGAVMEAGDKFLVYYENEDGIKAYKEVEVGATINKRTEIIGGLEEGERIIAG